MKNESIEAWKSKVKLLIRGKNVSRFLLRLHHAHIPILEVQKKSKEEVFIIIYFKDYEFVQKQNTIYDIHLVEYGGFLKQKKLFWKNRFLFFFLLLGLLFLFFFSHLIFHIEIITNDEKMRIELLEELKSYGITKGKWKKNYDTLEKIKEEILNTHKDTLEWIEIETIGTTYRVRFEPRIEETKEDSTVPRHLIASKNAILKKVESSKGQVMKTLNEYVKKGDIIVSGYLFLNDQIENTVSATGHAYGETWYEVDIFYPFGYYEKKQTGRKKKVYAFEFLSHRIELFNFHPFYDKIETRKVILEKRGIPFRFLELNQKEVEITSYIQTEEETASAAISLAITKIEGTLEGEEKILDYQIIQKKIEKDGVRLKIFFSVYEEITDYLEIEPSREEKDGQNIS